MAERYCRIFGTARSGRPEFVEEVLEMDPEELQRLKQDIETELELLLYQRQMVEARILANVFLLTTVDSMLGENDGQRKTE